MTTPIDKLLAVGGSLDWISPVLSMIQDVANGPHHDFLVDWNSGWSANEIKKLLKKHGIKVWGVMVRQEVIMFTVRKKQARWAQYVLQRNNIPIMSGLLPYEKTYKATKRKKKTSDWDIDSLFKWMDKL